MTSLLQKINELNVRVDNVSTNGGGGTTDTTALQAQIDTNTTDISGIQINKQNTLVAGDNITIANNTISSSGGGTATIPENAVFSSVNTETGTFTDKVMISNTPIETTDQAVNITSQLIVKVETFDTIILRRISGDNTLNLREIQLWINDINVLPTNTNQSQNQDNLSLGDKVDFFIQNANDSFSTRNGK